MKKVVLIIAMLVATLNLIAQVEKKGIKEKVVMKSEIGNPTEIDANFLNNLFIEKDLNNPILNPRLFKLVTKDIELKGMKVYIKKDNKIYKYLGEQNRVLDILTSPSNKSKECTDCTTRTCNGTVYDCSCYNGFCFCMICVEITKLEDIE